MTTDPPSQSRRGRALPATWWGIALVIAVPVLVLAAAAIAVLLLTVHPTTASDRIDLVKAGLTVGAGTGGVVALVLTGRRQWASEHAQRASEHDATERRATELYTKSADQLGSDKAPVRLAGFYALERLAESHPSQRQMIANLLCAYLRMPFEHRGDRAASVEIGAPPEFQITAEHRQEREVRLTAQAILRTHARRVKSGHRVPSAQYWGPLTLDLDGATLIDFDLSDCSVGAVTFVGAIFAGESADFDRGTFEQYAAFRDATFVAPASFHSAIFAGMTVFSDVSFDDDAVFDRAKFGGQTHFDNARFAYASFARATFTANITDSPGVDFDGAKFEQAIFLSTKAATPITFRNATFVRALFDAAVFNRGVTGLAGDPDSFSLFDATSEGEPLTVTALESAAGDELDEGEPDDRPAVGADDPWELDGPDDREDCAP
jgi:uncharacterized protein YjbI with pentapeptide repeats